MPFTHAGEMSKDGSTVQQDEGRMDDRVPKKGKKEERGTHSTKMCENFQIAVRNLRL